MFTVTWINAGTLFSVATPNEDTARMLGAMVPRARVWYTMRKGRPMLVRFDD